MSVSNVSIVSKALDNKKPVAPNVKLITLAGLVFGMLIGFAWGLIKELTDRTIKEISYLTDELELTNLGQVNFIGKIKDLDKIGDNTSRNEELSQSRSNRRI